MSGPTGYSMRTCRILGQRKDDPLRSAWQQEAAKPELPLETTEPIDQGAPEERSHLVRVAPRNEVRRQAMEEIEARFPSEWVLIGDPRTDPNHRLLEGRVPIHSPDRDKVDRKLLELRPPRFAFRYLGTLPEHMAMVL